MKLYAIADLHVGHALNATALDALDPSLFASDGLIICGDVGESVAHLDLVFAKTTACFKTVFWVPGNHELYSMPGKEQPKGVEKYDECVAVARKWGVWTPEDEWQTWGEGEERVVVAPCFGLYDYSFRPPEVGREEALAWAEESGVVAADEAFLFPEPYKTRDEWCEARVEKSERKLERAQEKGLPLVIVNHWPLRRDLVYIPRIPRFSLWCGTTRTEEWHARYNAKVVVSGHLHVRRTDWIDGVRFEEVSLGYPRQWVSDPFYIRGSRLARLQLLLLSTTDKDHQEDARSSGRDINSMLREILPGPPEQGAGFPRTTFRRLG